MIGSLIFDPKVWLIFGIVLVVADILVGAAHFLLAIGVAAILLAGILFGQEQGWYGGRVAIETWRGAALTLAGLSLASVAVIRLLTHGKRGSDINRY